MKKIVLSFFVLTLVFITTHVAFTYSASAPPAGLTNAPGENNCTNCHTSFPLTTAGSIWDNITLTSSVPLSQFLPNTTYVLYLSFSDPSTTKYGFEMTALEAGANPSSPSVGTFADSTLETEITTQGNRDYISHSTLGTSALGNTKTWVFHYTTPPVYTGVIDFYVTVNSTDGDGTNNGDQIFAKVFSPTVLPVKWGSCRVTSLGKTNTIEWVTSTETNNDRFEIERSENAIQWLKIASIKGKGNSNEQNKYSHKDKNDGGKTIFYRIKQIDFNGKFEYSKVLSATSTFLAERVTYNTHTGTIRIENNLAQHTATLYTLEGFPIARDEDGIELNVAHIKKGIYILELPSGSFQKLFIY